MDPYLQKLVGPKAQSANSPAPTTSELRAATEASPHEVRMDGDLRHLTSILAQRYEFMRQAGITFKGARDMYEVLGYRRMLTVRDFRDRYARGGLAGRVVDVFPNATWRHPVDVVEDEDPDTDTEFEKAYKSLDKRLKLQQKFLRLDKLAGLSSYSVLLLGTGDVDLASEMPKGNGPDKLLFVTPFLGGGGPGGNANSRQVSGVDADATIQEFELDIKSPRFGLPKIYRLKRTDLTGPALQTNVHWSRAIHVAEDLLQDDVYGAPTMERVWNLLDDLDKVTGGGSEAFWLRANQGLHLNVDKDMQLPAAVDAVAALKEQADEYKNQLTRWLRTRGVDVKTLGSDVADFSNPADAIITQIAGSKAIPKRILVGAEAGELASSQDRDNWKDQVEGRQNNHAGPNIVRPFIDRLVEYGYLPSPKAGPLEYQVKFPAQQTLTDAERNEGAKAWSSVNHEQGETVFTDDEIRDKWYGMEPLTPEQKAAEEKKKADRVAAAQSVMGPGAQQQEEEVKALTEAISRGNKDEILRLLDLFKLSSTQVQLTPALTEKVLEFSSGIPESELAEDGRESDIHITLKYGLHTADPAEVENVIAGHGQEIHYTLGLVDVFRAEAYDVVFIAVQSEDCVTLNNLIAESCENTNTHPVYTPHVTLAYVKKGFADKYQGLSTFAGFKGTASSIIFSSSKGERTEIALA